MTYCEDEYLQLSGLQHFAYCRRQWALIHIEKQWKENLLTTDGQLMHSRAHQEELRERRGDVLILRGLPVASAELGVSGQCDVVEFHQDSKGVPIFGEDGNWQPYPVEYKRGAPKDHNADELQLCAQAMCLEEMLCCTIEEGALYYGETRHRTVVPFTEDLRQQVKKDLEEMHELFKRGYTPKVRTTKSCGQCSLKELCLPILLRKGSVSEYLKAALEEKP